MSGEQILVVDDGADMRDFVINYVIKPNGYQALEARDGLEGFEIILRESPDLVILDLQMPRLDGIGLLEKLQEEGIRIPVVLMTFYGSEEIAIEVFRLGVKDYVIKPFTDDELLDAIERALVEGRLRKERNDLQRRLVIVNHDLQQRVQEFSAVVRMGQRLARSSDPAGLLLEIVSTMGDLARSTDVDLYILDPQSGELIRRATIEDKAAVFTDALHSPDRDAWRAFQQGDLVIGEPYADPQGYMVQIALPVVVRDAPQGVLVVHLLADDMADHRLKMFSALADYAAIILEQARLVRGQS